MGVFHVFLNCANGTTSPHYLVYAKILNTRIFSRCNPSHSSTYPPQHRRQYVLNFTMYHVICLRNFKYIFCIFRSNPNFEKQNSKICHYCFSSFMHFCRLYLFLFFQRKNETRNVVILRKYLIFFLKAQSRFIIFRDEVYQKMSKKTR